MLRYIVIQYINGRTDWYDLAAFEFEVDAQEFAATHTQDGIEVKAIKVLRYELID